MTEEESLRLQILLIKSREHMTKDDWYEWDTLWKALKKVDREKRERSDAL